MCWYLSIIVNGARLCARIATRVDDVWCIVVKSKDGYYFEKNQVGK